jgi:hypothetical protein
MSRIRSIKPEFWSSEQVMACAPVTRLLFIGLWNFADDGGRLSNSAKSIKAQIFPGDDDVDSTNVRRMLDELSSNELLLEYEVDGRAYFQITGWHHQRIDRPRPSKIPPPPLSGNSTNVRRPFVPDLILSDPIRSYSFVDPRALGDPPVPKRSSEEAIERMRTHKFERRKV